MELVLSATFLLKVVFFLFGAGLLGVLCLSPINDQPTGAVQVVVWTVLVAILFSLMFGFITIKFTP